MSEPELSRGRLEVANFVCLGACTLVVLLGFVLAASWQSSLAELLADEQRAGELRDEDKAISTPARARLHARRGLEEHLAQLRRLAAAGAQVPREGSFERFVGMTFDGGEDRVTVRFESAANGEQTVRSEGSVAERLAFLEETRRVLAACVLTARLRVGAGGVEVISIDLQETATAPDGD